MRNLVTWCMALLAMAGTAFSETKDLPKELVVDLGDGVKLEMALAPTGSFMMGDGRDRPVHRVTITRPFYLGKYEVTQEQWEAVMDGNPSYFKGPKSPVERVSWNHCRKFFEKLNAKVGTQGGKFSLPTEAQWEYACRAGSTSRYCCGDDDKQLEQYAWYGGKQQTHPVGQKEPNAWGLYDMHGNVWEWCADWFAADYYEKSPTDDPAGPATGATRVFRGGSWDYPAEGCRSATRSHYAPNYGDCYLGLRVCRDPAE